VGWIVRNIRQTGVTSYTRAFHRGGGSAHQVARACSFTAASGGPSTQILLAVCVHLRYTKVFKGDKWAIHYYAPIQGHELLTRRDLIPSEPDHPRAGAWYYALQLGRLEHKLPPIVANRWRRVTFIVTSGDRFRNAVEINALFEQESPVGQLYVRLEDEPGVCLQEIQARLRTSKA